MTDELHHVDFGGAAELGTLVLVHGLGGSHLNWDLLAPALVGHARVLAVDLPGFGLSAPSRRPATLRRNVEALTRFVRRVADPPVVLVGNSMGGLVSALVTARSPELVRALVLVAPALPAPARVLGSPRSGAVLALHALPGVGERLRRRRRERIGAAATLRETLVLGGVDPDRLPADLVERAVGLVARQSDVAGMDRAFLSASRSLAWALVHARPYRAALAAVRVPVLLVHGDRDRLVPVEASRDLARRHPRWSYVELAGAGHLPQLSVPDELAGHLLTWLAALPPPGSCSHS